MEEPLQPQSQLAMFLRRDVYDFLSYSMEYLPLITPSFVRPLNSTYLAAWREVEEVIPIAAGQVEELGSAELAAHGLTDSQLRMKLHSVKRGLSRVRRGFQGIIERGPEYSRKRRARLARLFRWGAEGIDKILESLALIVPLVGAIAEFKGTIEWASRGISLRI